MLIRKPIILFLITKWFVSYLILAIFIITSERIEIVRESRSRDNVGSNGKTLPCVIWVSVWIANASEQPTTILCNSFALKKDEPTDITS